MIERCVYSNPDGSADFNRAAFPTVPKRFLGTPTDLVASLNQGGDCAVFEPFGASTDGEKEFTSGVFGVSINGADNDTFEEQEYLVRRTQLSGANALELQSLGLATWTCGANAITTFGGRAGHKDAKAVAWSADTGYLGKLTGRDVQSSTNEPACVMVGDVGEAAGVLRVFRRTSGSGGLAPLRCRWR